MINLNATKIKLTTSLNSRIFSRFSNLVEKKTKNEINNVNKIIYSLIVNRPTDGKRTVSY